MIPMWRQSNTSKILLMLLFCALSMIPAKAQPPELGSFFGSLISNDNYLTAYASSSEESEAKALSRLSLRDTVSVWLQGRNLTPETDFSSLLLPSKSISCNYEDKFYVFTYIDKDSIFKRCGSGAGAFNPLSERRSAIANIYVAKLLKSRTMHDVNDILAELGANNKMHYCGRIQKSTNPRLIDNALLVIFDDSGNVAALLSEKMPQRVNLGTGKEDSTRNYSGMNAIWIMFY